MYGDRRAATGAYIVQAAVVVDMAVGDDDAAQAVPVQVFTPLCSERHEAGVKIGVAFLAAATAIDQRRVVSLDDDIGVGDQAGEGAQGELLNTAAFRAIKACHRADHCSISITRHGQGNVPFV
jgi:hypothetical protein